MAFSTALSAPLIGAQPKNKDLLSVFGISAAVLACVQWLSYMRRRRPNLLAPLIEYNKGGDYVKSIERFGVYVVRQLGIPPEHGCAPTLARAADDYLKGDKTKADKSREQLLELVTSACATVSEQETKCLAKQLVVELDACMLTYFAFHWKHAGLMVDQVIHGPKRKFTFKDAVLAATRTLRFQKVMEHLGPQRKLAVLLEEIKLLTLPEQSQHVVPTRGEVLVPANEAVRSPVLLLIGGGMGAGKSTAVKEVMKTPFWSKVAHQAVTVEADAFKEKDAVYRALVAQETGDVAEISQLVHEASTQAASSMLVTALNEGRDVIFDGTMSWETFVMQTIQMARNVHKRRYRLGPGYQKLPDGSVMEQYWEPVREGEEVPVSPCNRRGGLAGTPRLPYRIEVVGVVCDAHLAVMRGMRRAILTRRGVPVEGQLRSHQLFAQSLERYCAAVDKATIYCTNGIGKTPTLIGYKEGNSKLLVDTDSITEVKKLADLNIKADNALELFQRAENWWTNGLFRLGLQQQEQISQRYSAWQSVVMASDREARQEALREAFLRLQACARTGSKVDPFESPLLLARMQSKSAPSLRSKYSGFDELRQPVDHKESR